MALVDDLLLTPDSDVRSMSDAAVKAAEALEKLNGYARHKRTCGYDEYPCDCGLNTLRAQIFGETSDGGETCVTSNNHKAACVTSTAISLNTKEPPHGR